MDRSINEWHRQRAQDARAVADKVGDAKETPALFDREDFRDHILPADNNGACPKAVPGIQHKEHHQGQAGPAGRQEVCRRGQQQDRHPLQEKAERHREKLLPGGAFHPVGRKQLRQQVTRRGEERDDAEQEGIIGKMAHVQGQDNGA